MTKSFIAATLAAVLASKAHAQIDCAVDTQTTLDVDGFTVIPAMLPITQELCECLPNWAQAFYDDGANFKWTKYET